MWKMLSHVRTPLGQKLNQFVLYRPPKELFTRKSWIKLTDILALTWIVRGALCLFLCCCFYSPSGANKTLKLMDLAPVQAHMGSLETNIFHLQLVRGLLLFSVSQTRLWSLPAHIYCRLRHFERLLWDTLRECVSVCAETHTLAHESELSWLPFMSCITLMSRELCLRRSRERL